jgi:hypothetical protein
MTSLLDEAIEILRKLPEDHQDRMAEFVFAYLASNEEEDRRPSTQITKPRPTNR